MAKRQTTRKARGKLAKKGLPRFLWLAAVLAVAIIIATVGIFVVNKPASNSSHELKAAIVDQLYAFNHPNQEFIEEVTNTLESYGFQVDLCQGDEVTVDFYRELPQHGYKFIIFRTHSGLIKLEGQAELKTSLFTSEGYRRTKYVTEQLNEELVKARVDEGYPFYFAIDSKFITNRMKGQFDDTVIIIAGCSGLCFDDLAQAFTHKGASAYLAWDRTVNLDYVDDATIALTENLCAERLTLDEAVARTMEEKGPDPEWEAVLKYYPAQSGNKTIAELIGKANSTALSRQSQAPGSGGISG